MPLDRRLDRQEICPNLTDTAIYLNMSSGSLRSVYSNLKQIIRPRSHTCATNRFKADAAEAYSGAYNDIIKRLAVAAFCMSTRRASASRERCSMGFSTSLDRGCLFPYSDPGSETITRCSRIYSGVMVSEFLRGVRLLFGCPQQKMPDPFHSNLNDDLLKHPHYDDELKRLVGALPACQARGLKTVDRRGLKKRLRKARVFVDRFYSASAMDSMRANPRERLSSACRRTATRIFHISGFRHVPWNNNKRSTPSRLSPHFAA